MEFEKGQIITLDGNKEYLVVDIIEHNNLKYAYLCTIEKPLEIMLCKIETRDSHTELVEIDNLKEATEVLKNIKE